MLAGLSSAHNRLEGPDERRGTAAAWSAAGRSLDAGLAGCVACVGRRRRRSRLGAGSVNSHPRTQKVKTARSAIGCEACFARTRAGRW
jgi:hypothetical protein